MEEIWKVLEIFSTTGEAGGTSSVNGNPSMSGRPSSGVDTVRSPPSAEDLQKFSPHAPHVCPWETNYNMPEFMPHLNGSVRTLATLVIMQKYFGATGTALTAWVAVATCSAMTLFGFDQSVFGT